MKVVIVGRGKVGTALFAAGKKRANVAIVSSRQESAARSRKLALADLVILAVPDDSITPVARSIEPLLRRAVVAHCSGSRSSQELAEVFRGHKTAIGACHPLLAVASAKKPPTVAGSSWLVGGDKPAVTRLSSWLQSLGAHVIRSDAHGPLYHAAAVLVANGATALAGIGEEIFAAAGLSETARRDATASLLQSVVDNIRTLGAKASLTGPVARGDFATVKKHQQAIESSMRARANLSAYNAVLPLIAAAAKRAAKSD